MILTCPACSTRYQADEAKFPSQGRTVRCAKCGHSWHEPGPEPQTQAEEPPAPAAPLFSPAPEPIAVPSPTRAFAPAAKTPPVPQRGARLQAFGVGVGWLALVAAVLLIGYSAVKYRQDVAALWPQSAGLYAGLGLAVNSSGIDFRGVTYKRQSEDGQPVLEVTGAIVNKAQRELPVPQTVRVTLVDADGRELYHWSFKPDAQTLKAGQAVAFRTRLSSPPAAARHLEVRFAKDQP